MKTRDSLKIFASYYSLLAKMKVLLILAEKSCKAGTKIFPFHAISHEN